MTACAFCSAPIDPAAAAVAADELSVVNQACSDASYLKILATAMVAFFIIQLIPFLGSLGTIGFYGTMFGTPAFAIYWWSQFGSLKSTDPEYLVARKQVPWVGLSGVAVIFARLLLIVLFHH